MVKIIKSRVDLLRMLFIRDFKALYIHNMLGLVWVILNPLLMVILYSFVFAVILKIRGQGGEYHYSYAVFLLAGMIPYLAITDAIQSSASCLQQKKDLMIKSVFPAMLLPINSVLISLVSELVSLILLLCLALYETNGQFQWIWLGLPVLVVLRILFSLAVAWWVSIFSLFMPDIRQVLNAVLPAWMFLTPILYVKEQAPAYFQTLQLFNPLFYIVEAYRAILLEGQWPAIDLGLIFAVLILVNLLGYWMFRRLMPRAKDFL